MEQGWKLRKNQCVNCPFGNNPIDLSEERRDEIESYLKDGMNHFCHADTRNKTICFGGRLFQLSEWARLGKIPAPTHKALAQEMLKSGVVPAKHITDNIGKP